MEEWEVGQMKRKAVLIQENDTVLTVLEPVQASEVVTAGTEELIAMEDIPQYHKIARVEMRRGDVIYKYGQPMGYATADIGIGQWVHTHNADSVQPEEEAWYE